VVVRGPQVKRALVSCDISEHHRAATSPELLFDLCFVIVVSQAVSGLHHFAIELV
jgi:low temperature requirement protein LtrA